MPQFDSPFDAKQLRQVLGTFVTGVTVITTVDSKGAFHGLTVNSFSSVSLDPPLILWSQSKTSPSHPVFNEAERFAVNILSDDQVAISNRFSRANVDKFAETSVIAGLGGVPLIQGCSAHLECRRVQTYPGGDHVVFLGEVERIARHPSQPLVFGDGRYLMAGPHDLGVSRKDKGACNVAQLTAIRLATRAMVELSHELDQTLGLGVWGNHGPTMIRWEESSQPISEKLRTGLVLPMHTSATGLAFATWLPRDLTADFLDAELAELGNESHFLDVEQLPQRLTEFRAAGVVRLVGTDEFQALYGTAISAVSVPVFDPSGAMVLALTAIGAAGRIDIEENSRLCTGLLGCSTSITQRLTAAAIPLAA